MNHLVTILETGITLPRLEVNGSDILNLVVIKPDTPPQPATIPPISQQRPPSTFTTPAPNLAPSRYESASPQTPQLTDPAILASAPLRSFQPSPAFPPQQQGQSHVAFSSRDDDTSSESSVDPDPYTADHIYRNEQRQKVPAPQPKTQKKISSNQRERGKNRQIARAQPHHGGRDDWTSQDVSNVQDSDFDFQANLDRFDKALVFDEIRQHDQTSINDRLVTFNRIKKSDIKPGRTVGVNGQVKFGNKEMIVTESKWDVSDEDNKDLVGDDEEDDFISDVPPPPPNRRPSRPQLQDDSVKLIAETTKKPCLCASPLQLVELERMMSDTYGIPDTILTENAGRGVATLALQSLGGASRFNYSNHNSRPLVVVLASNSRTGAKALAAARHLANRQIKIIALAVGCVEDRQQSGADEVLAEIKIQVKALESCKGIVVTRYDELMTQLSLADCPPELLIDGLQGYQLSFDDFSEQDLTTVKSVLDWGNNKQRSPIMSLDIPSGIDSATGLPGNKDIKPLNARWVLSCGLPLTGIRNAYLTGTVSPGDWTHLVVDVGFPKRSLQKRSLRRFGQIWFGADWLLPLEVVID